MQLRRLAWFFGGRDCVGSKEDITIITVTGMMRILNKRSRLISSGTLLCIGVLFSTHSFADAKMLQRLQGTDPLWLAVEKIEGGEDFSLRAVEFAFPGTYKIVRETPNTFFYESYDVELGPQRKISRIDLRVSKTRHGAGFFLAEVGDGCIPMSEVRSMNPTLVPYPPPPHGNVTELVFSAERKYGTLYFSFGLEDRNCLTRVSFDRRP